MSAQPSQRQALGRAESFKIRAQLASTRDIECFIFATRRKPSAPLQSREAALVDAVDDENMTVSSARSSENPLSPV